MTDKSISATNDMSVMRLKYINIKRGCVLSAITGGWVIVLWKILADAQTFLAFMGGDAFFLGPMAGIIAFDYWLIKRMYIDVPAPYNSRGRYRFPTSPALTHAPLSPSLPLLVPSCLA
jgi:NCS1 family nucleobase:cation symporter-1